MHKNFLVAGAIAGGLAVALGAFGAHGLERITGDEKILHGFQTGVQYQFYHALALLVVAIIYEKVSNRWIKWSGSCFIAGIILFSGSLYLLTLLKDQKARRKIYRTGNANGRHFLYSRLVVSFNRSDE